MRIDFHIHTHHSYDSLMKPSKIIRLAKKRGLDGIVVCDHNTIKGGLEARRVNRDKNFVVIVASEIATNAGDVTGLFLEKEIVSRDFDDVVAEIRAQNGKVLLNHPFKGHDLSKIDFSKLDFIEGYNARLSNEDNEKAVQLAKKHNLPIIAGSDAHLYGEIGNCSTVVTSLEEFYPVDFSYHRSKQIYVTLSQYVKALKRKNLSVFVSATKVQIKYWIRPLLYKIGVRI